MTSVAFWINSGSVRHVWQAADYSKDVEQHFKLHFLPAYVACTVEPPAGERPRSLAHRSAGNELVGRLHMMQLGREGFEMSVVAVCSRSVVWPKTSEDWSEQQWFGPVFSCVYETGSSILHYLVSSEKMTGNAVEQAVSIIKAKRHVGPRYEP